MAKARYLQITFDTEGPPKIDQLKPSFDKALDWIRIAPNSWIVWTTSTPDGWYNRLKSKLGPNDHLYIFGIDNSSRQGWAPQWIWDWLDKKR